MSFSGDTKRELCKIKNKRPSHSVAECYGILLCAKQNDQTIISIKFEQEESAKQYSQELAAMTGAMVDIKTHIRRKTDMPVGYTVSVPSDEQQQQVLSFFGHTEQIDKVNEQWLAEDGTPEAFLRGVFLACGTITAPEKEYRLEMVCARAVLAGHLKKMLQEWGISCKQTVRSGAHVIYLGDSAAIEDFLTLIGATRAALEVMSMKVYRDIRNIVNRQTNCETANIEKTVSAAALQIKAIRRLEQTSGLSALPDDLRQAAQLRQVHPDLSLRELVQHSNFSLSGLDRRLKKLVELARAQK